MSEELPRTLKFATIWLVLGALVFVGFEWHRHEALKASFTAAGGIVEIRRADDGHYHWPGTLNGTHRRLPRRHRRERRRDPGRARRAARPALRGRPVRSSTAGGSDHRPRSCAPTSRSRAACASSGCAWCAAAAGGRRCSAWTCSAAALAAARRCAAHRPRRAGAQRRRRDQRRCARRVVCSCGARRSAVRSRLARSPPTRLRLAAEACPPAAPHDAERFQRGLRDATDHGFLWRISKDGRTSYLYGTIHAARSSGCSPGPTVARRGARERHDRARARRARPGHPAAASPPASPPGDETLPAALGRASTGARARMHRRGAVARLHARVPGRLAQPSWRRGARASIRPTRSISCSPCSPPASSASRWSRSRRPKRRSQALQLPTHAATIEFVQSGLDDLESGRAGPLLAAHGQGLDRRRLSPSLTPTRDGASACATRPSARR